MPLFIAHQSHPLQNLTVSVRKVVIWDDRNTRIMAELRFKTAVRSVQPLGRRFSERLVGPKRTVWVRNVLLMYCEWGMLMYYVIRNVDESEEKCVRSLGREFCAFVPCDEMTQVSKGFSGGCNQPQGAVPVPKNQPFTWTSVGPPVGLGLQFQNLKPAALHRNQWQSQRRGGGKDASRVVGFGCDPWCFWRCCDSILQTHLR